MIRTLQPALKRSSLFVHKAQICKQVYFSQRERGKSNCASVCVCTPQPSEEFKLPPSQNPSLTDGFFRKTIGNCPVSDVALLNSNLHLGAAEACKF